MVGLMKMLPKWLQKIDQEASQTEALFMNVDAKSPPHQNLKSTLIQPIHTSLLLSSSSSQSDHASDPVIGRYGMPNHAPSSTSPSLTTPHPHSLPLPRISRPLGDHPQLEIVETPLSSSPLQDGPRHVEYRVHHWRRLGSGRVVRGDGWGPVDLICWVGVVYWAWSWDLGSGVMDWLRGMWSSTHWTCPEVCLQLTTLPPVLRVGYLASPSPHHES